MHTRAEAVSSALQPKVLQAAPAGGGAVSPCVVPAWIRWPCLHRPPTRAEIATVLNPTQKTVYRELGAILLLGLNFMWVEY